MKKPVVAFTPSDEENLKYVEMMRNSLRKFHSEEELPLVVMGPDRVFGLNDQQIFYRATPYFARDLLKEYDTVIKLDADQVICGSLEHLWKGADFDMACVHNGNPKEPPYGVWDVGPNQYLNCGLVAMRSEEMVNHWWSLCDSPHFQPYQMKEQDLMNIIVYYGNYKVKFLDIENKLHGLASKGYWQYIKLDGDKLILPGNSEGGYPNADKEIVVIHWAGGNQPNKLHFETRFQEDVVKKLKWLTQ